MAGFAVLLVYVGNQVVHFLPQWRHNLVVARHRYILAHDNFCFGVVVLLEVGVLQDLFYVDPCVGIEF